MQRILLHVFPAIVGLLLVYSGVGKLLHPVHATMALEAVGVSHSLSNLIIVVITIAELYLGLILVLRWDLRFGLVAAIGLMFSFVVFMWYLSMMANPPACGCLGITRVFESNKHEAWFGLLRNCAILWALKLSYDYHQRTGWTGTRSKPLSMSQTTPSS